MTDQPIDFEKLRTVCAAAASAWKQGFTSSLPVAQFKALMLEGNPPLVARLLEMAEPKDVPGSEGNWEALLGHLAGLTPELRGLILGKVHCLRANERQKSWRTVGDKTYTSDGLLHEWEQAEQRTEAAEAERDEWRSKYVVVKVQAERLEVVERDMWLAIQAKTRAEARVAELRELAKAACFAGLHRGDGPLIPSEKLRGALLRMKEALGEG